MAIDIKLDDFESGQFGLKWPILVKVSHTSLSEFGVRIFGHLI